MPPKLHPKLIIPSTEQWGLVNFDASTLWVRDRKHLTDALDITPEFLRTKEGDAGMRSDTELPLYV